MIANIRPGILVAMRTRIVGGVEYRREDLPPPEDVREGADARRWETVRVVDDPEEWESARAARGAAQSAVGRVCLRTDFGLLCPESREAELDAAVGASRELAAAHNRRKGGARVEVYVMKGRVASTDQEAARGIAAEVRGLLDEMRAGIGACDAEAVRAAASRARRMGQMLDDDAARAVGEAVSEAREAAREIVRRVGEGGEEAAAVAETLGRAAIDSARCMFLDVDAPAAPEPAPPAPRRDLDVAPAPAKKSKPKKK